MCYMWTKIQHGVRWVPQERLKVAARAMNLSKVKSILISLDPLYRDTTALRDFWYHATSAEVKATNPDVKITAQVRNDGKEPYFVADLNDDKKIVFKTSGLLGADVVMRFNQLLGNPRIGNLRIEEEQILPETFKPDL